MRRKVLRRVLCLSLVGTVLFQMTAPVFAAESEYPQFDVKGYSKYEFFNLGVDPKTNFFLAQTNLGSVSQTLGVSGPWQNRLKLQINGKLSELVALAYDIEQEPELPQKSDVVMDYGTNKLTFGDFSADYKGNEFATATKFLNGLMYSAKTSDFEMILIPSAKLRSNTLPLQVQKGNNTRGPYSLGRGTLVEGSERIEVNQVLQKRGVDYTIDYFEGKVTFGKILLPTDEIRYSFEFTNIADLFAPTTSRRDFFGIQARGRVDPSIFQGTPPVQSVAVSRSHEQLYPERPAATQEASLLSLKRQFEASLEAVEKVAETEIVRMPSLDQRDFLQHHDRDPGLFSAQKPIMVLTVTK